MAAVAMLGLVGFTVAGWFVLLGAPDLALTQLLIETLTVVLVVLVFRHLPPYFPRGGPRRKVGAAVVAVTVGTFAGLATFLLTGRRDLSDVGAQFLAEGEGLTGGANVVNTILVDFRALDTLGEIAVLAVAAAGMIAIIRMPERGAMRRPVARDHSPETPRPLPRVGMIDSPILRTAGTLLAPAMVVASLWLLVRGHDAVGGGFIGGLTGRVRRRAAVPQPRPRAHLAEPLPAGHPAARARADRGGALRPRRAGARGGVPRRREGQPAVRAVGRGLAGVRRRRVSSWSSG
jgi:multicomponent Na+:H+ antiporter subunit A